MIAALEVHELLNKIRNILDNVVSKWVGNIPLYFSLSL